MLARKILVVDDEHEMLESCKRILTKMGHKCLTTADSEKAISIINQERPDLIITDLKMPQKDGIELINDVKQINKDLPIIVLTGFASIESAVEAMKKGAFDYLAKPFTLDQFRITVERALEKVSLSEENKLLKERLQQTNQFNNIIGASSAMQETFEVIRKVAKSDANVIILGESGTGKESAANSIHINSHRAKHPFIAVDCASLPDQLLESELFGYEKGAFTGAATTKAGLVELANGGTLFLDEIGELSINLQAKLLRVLQERKIRRVGGTKLIDVDVRIVTATNRNLQQMVKQGTFREDLYYRLNVISIKLPPLRERFGDVALLSRYYCERFAAQQEKSLEISPQALNVLNRWVWPGNIRELKNVIERAVVFAENGEIRVEDLPNYILGEPEQQERAGDKFPPFAQAKQNWIADFEKKYLTDLLVQCQGNISQAAREAGMDRRNMHRLIAKHNINIKKQNPNPRFI